MNPLQNRRGQIIDGHGKPVRLRGVNLGNWLLVEGYLLAGPNEPEHRIRACMAEVVGASQTRAFYRKYQDAYIQASDLRRIRRWGFNFVRIPFNYRLFLPSPQGRLYARDGWKRLDWVIKQCSRLGLYCLLDLHAAPGAQNADWHSDSPGKPGLWDSPKDQEETTALWGKIARRYRDEPAVAGYDLLNEPVASSTVPVMRLYRRCLEAIREAGDHHLVFLEGTRWSDDFEGLDEMDDPQLVYSPHFYKPAAFVLHLDPDAAYPGEIEGKYWNKQTLRGELERFHRLGQKSSRPVLIGEFGVHRRCPCCHAETRWVKEALGLFESFEFHWTYWVYKALDGPCFPNGLLQLPGNPSWLRREGAKCGWQNFGRVLARSGREILSAMDSRHFREDPIVLEELQRAVRS